jgi:hypothetical protein
MIGFLEDENLIFDIFELIIADAISLKAFYCSDLLCLDVLSHIDLRIMAFTNLL